MTFVTKNNWTTEPFNMDKIRETYKRICYWFNSKCPFSELEQNIENFIIDWISTQDINKIIIRSAISLISPKNTSWEYIAGRFGILNLYKEAKKSTGYEESELYTWEYFEELINEYVDRWLYYKDYKKHYTDEEIIHLWNYIDCKRDMTYNHTTVWLYNSRYLLNRDWVIRELPQHMYMAIAMYLAIPEDKENRIDFVKRVYNACSRWEISLPTPTLLNARTNFHQLSSCFKFNVDDDLRAIYHNIENMAQVSKYGWGIGVYLGNIRSRGGTIRGVKWTSWWVNPWVKVINDTAIAVNQLGARAWAISVTLDVFHRDIYSFLDMQTETGDIRAKAFDLFPAVTFPDLFMERVENNLNWTLFDPKEVYDVTGKKLQDMYWEEFNKFYMECEQNAQLTLKEVVVAKDLFKKYLKCTVETGMPYAFFRDTVNELNPNKHCWMIYNTNLCTEIQQNTSASKFTQEVLDTESWEVAIKYMPWDTVTCNLASINCAKVYTDEKIAEILPVAMRVLDNVIELNMFPVKEAELTAKKYRPVGLWFLWLAQRLAENQLNYESEEARNYVDGLFKKYSFHTLRASVDLAKERGAYPMFEWSEWSKGCFNWESISDKYPEEGWFFLKQDMKEYWTRFGYHFAPAPNTSTSLVVWTTAAVLPVYKKFFTESNSKGTTVNVAPNLNAETFWYYKEYTAMDMNNVIDMVSVIYKWVDQSISFEWMVNPAKVTPKELYGYYFKSWRQGIKTVYYVRSQSAEINDDCASCSW